MLWSNLEYVPLRLARRLLFTDRVLLRLGRFLPYYRTNQGQISVEPIAAAYAELLARKGLDLADRDVLEAGCGAANGTGYALAAGYGARWTGLEPYAPFDAALDARFREETVRRHPDAGPLAVRRIESLAGTPDARFDLILSNSVLEHVFDFEGLMRELFRVLRPDGCMLHRVDYRDHFFKYPFHFLQFAETAWQGVLGPGDLTRRRLPEHVTLMRDAGFDVELLEITRDRESFDRMRKHLHPRFRVFPDEELCVTGAAIFARKRQ